MKKGRLQCKDCDTLAILKFIAEHTKDGDSITAYSPDIAESSNNYDPMPWLVLAGRALDRASRDLSIPDAFPVGSHQNLVKAKMTQLVNKGLVGGCSCGCRGDFTITDKGREFLAAEEQSK